MGILTDFYVAPRSAADAILRGKTAKLKRFEAKRIDPVKLASLEKVAAEALGGKGSPGETVLLTDEDAEQWVFLVSPSLVALLARAGAKTAAIAKSWAATPDKSERWTAATAKQVLASLIALAVDATKTKRDLLLRMSL